MERRKYRRTFTEEPEEKTGLKKFINQLQQQLVVQRGRMQAERRKTHEYTRALSREFQKEQFYSGSHAHLVTGVKHQYELLRKAHDALLVQCDALRKLPPNTRLLELETHCQTLQQDNKFLLEALLQNNLQKINTPSRKADTPSRKDLTQHREALKEKDLKIQFLQRILIEKDNNQAHARKIAKRLQREKYVLQESEGRIRKELERQKGQAKRERDTLLAQAEQKAILEQQQYEKILLQKNIQIEKLEKEIRFMSTLISHWKPLDVKENGKEAIEKEEQTQLHSKIQQDMKQIESKHPIDNSEGSVFIEDASIVRTLSNDLREHPQTAAKRHTPNAIKCRKVTAFQIAPIGQLLKYRFISRNLTIDEAKAKFHHPHEEYVAMREVKRVLQEAPFSLQREEAHLFARYIVEDCPNEHVYCDEENEASRQVVKSILKASVPLFKAGHGKEEWQKTTKAYATNMKLALKSVAPKGVIPIKDFLELLNGLGIELSEEAKDFSIGEMIEESKSLHALKYDVLFR